MFYAENASDIMIFHDVYVLKLLIIFHCNLDFAIFRPFLKLDWNISVLNENRNNSIVFEEFLC